MAEKMRTSRGKLLMVLEGFGYVQHKLNSEGKQLWRCVQQRKFKCGGRAISDLDLADFRATQEHASHCTQASLAVEKFLDHTTIFVCGPEICMSLACVCRMRLEPLGGLYVGVSNCLQKRAVRTTLKTNAIAQRDRRAKHVVEGALEEHATRVLRDDGYNMYDTFYRLVRRCRELPGRKDVDSCSVKDIVLSGGFTKTKLNGVFFAWDSRFDHPDLPIVFLFLSDSGVSRLRSHPNWSADRHFTLVPRNLMQLYTVGVLVDHYFIPYAFAFTQNRSAQTYLRLFRKILPSKIASRQSSSYFFYERS